MSVLNIVNIILCDTPFMWQFLFPINPQCSVFSMYFIHVFVNSPLIIKCNSFTHERVRQLHSSGNFRLRTRIQHQQNVNEFETLSKQVLISLKYIFQKDVVSGLENVYSPLHLFCKELSVFFNLYQLDDQFCILKKVRNYLHCSSMHVKQNQVVITATMLFCLDLPN